MLYIHDLVENVFQTYELSVLETKPGKAVSIIETDMNVSRSIVLMEGYHTNSYEIILILRFSDIRLLHIYVYNLVACQKWHVLSCCSHKIYSKQVYHFRWSLQHRWATKNLNDNKSLSLEANMMRYSGCEYDGEMRMLA